MAFVVRSEFNDGRASRNRVFDTRRQAEEYQSLMRATYRRAGITVTIEEISTPEDIGQAERDAEASRTTLRDLEIKIMKVRGQDLYYISFGAIDQIGWKGTEIEALKYLNATYKLKRGTKEELESIVPVIKGMIADLYRVPLKEDLDRIIGEVREMAGLTVPRKTAVVWLDKKLEKLPYFSELVEAVAHKFFEMKWFEGVNLRV